jgi:hypothetical protein
MYLVGREKLIATWRPAIVAGTSLLLVGPPGAGKSALIRAITSGMCVDVVDPFEHVSRARAARLRRALDRGHVVLGATRDLDRRHLGAVGRILWRFRILRVPPLPLPAMRALIRSDLARRGVDVDVDAAWLAALARRAAGLPGRGRLLASAAAGYWHRCHGFPAVEWAAVDAMTCELPWAPQAGGREEYKR